MMCYYYDMQKEELQNFFNNENKVFQLNCISDSLLNSFDENLLSLFDENTFSKEVYAVYKKFSSMDMDAPDKLKNELFDKVRNFNSCLTYVLSNQIFWCYFSKFITF